MSETIITDTTALRQISTKAKVYNHKAAKATQEIIDKLVSTLPPDDLGLAAPQINIFQRVFVARLSTGLYVFINPTVELSNETFSSTEGCLSLPGISRCIERSQSVSISADVIYKVFNSQYVTYTFEDRLYNLDAAIVQHEYDHLEGVLMIDYPEVEPQPEIEYIQHYKQHQKEAELQSPYLQRLQKKKQKVLEKRQNRKQVQAKKKVTLSKKQKSKLEKLFKSSDKKHKRKVELEAQIQAMQDEIEEEPS